MSAFLTASLVLALLVSSFSVSAGHRIITAEPGDNVILPCRAAENKEVISVHWKRTDLESDQHVLLYIFSQFDPEGQSPSFSNQVSLLDVKNGDVSLILKSVTTHNTGRYECRVVQRENNRRKRFLLSGEPNSIINLIVGPDRINITAEPGDNVILPYRADKMEDVRILMWRRTDLESGQFVLLYRDWWLYPERRFRRPPSFRKRVSLLDVKNRNMSLVLKNVTTDDTGIYVCPVFERGKYHRGIQKSISIINLRVEPGIKDGGSWPGLISGDISGKMASGMIERAALGRTFTLGMLYDARKDQLIPGITLWDEKTLQKMTEENSKHGSEFRISASDSLEEKSSLLDVSGSLKASFLGGLIEVGGSAKYLNDQKKSKNQSRVTFQYKATTIFKELKMSTDEMNKTQQIGVNVKSCATHVVTGILYGAYAFFVLDSEKLDESSTQDIKGNIHAVINKISSLSASGEVDLKLSDKEKAVTEKFTCKFYGDVIPESNPVTFEEAVKTYRKLPELLGKNKENTVPVKVWMMPLKNFDPLAAEMTTDLSPGLVRKVQKTREDFHKLNMRCNDCLEGSFGFPKIKERLESFQQQCTIYGEKLLDVIAKKIPFIRAGEEDEKELLKILDDSEKSPFSSEKLMKWMTNIEREVSVITLCLKEMKGAKIVQSEAELVEELLNPEVQDVLIFVFTSLKTTDPYLDKMKDYLDSLAMKATEDMDQSINNLLHFPEIDLLNMTRKAEEFGTFVKGLKNNKKFRFLVAAIKNKQHNGATIYHYRNRRLLTEDFSKPDVCDVEKATDRSDLIWYASDLTFDPNTINGRLNLSQGNKMLKQGDQQSYPDHPKRFDVLPQVLCQESLTERHYWEVELSTDEGRDAAAAVCYEGIQRKSKTAWAGIGWNAMSWSLGHKWEPQPVFYAEHNSSVIFYPLPHTGCPCLGVFLDWPAGTLSYYIVAGEKLSHIHTFHTRFSEPVYPCFKVGRQNSYALLCF